MTSRERVLAAIRGEPVDCVPVGPMMMDMGAVVGGFSVGEYCSSAHALAEGQLALWREFGQDIIFLGSDNYYIAEGFGCICNHPDDETPDLAVPPCASIRDVFDLKVPNPLTDGRMPNFLEAIRRVRQVVGDQVAIRAPGTGPTSLASYFVGTQRFVLEMGLVEMEMEDADEEAVHKALDLAADALIAFHCACIDAGADIVHCGDSLASGDMISPHTYERFSFPAERKVIQEVNAYAHPRGAYTLLHICGDNTRTLELFVQTGADIIEVDHKVPLDYARDLIAGRSCILGNVDPVKVLLETPDEIRRISQECIDICRDTPRYMLGTGCQVPRTSPLANVHAMVEVARHNRRG